MLILCVCLNNAGSFLWRNFNPFIRTGSLIVECEVSFPRVVIAPRTSPNCYACNVVRHVKLNPRLNKPTTGCVQVRIHVVVKESLMACCPTAGTIWFCCFDISIVSNIVNVGWSFCSFTASCAWEFNYSSCITVSRSFNCVLTHVVAESRSNYCAFFCATNSTLIYHCTICCTSRFNRICRLEIVNWTSCKRNSFTTCEVNFHNGRNPTPLISSISDNDVLNSLVIIAVFETTDCRWIICISKVFKWNHIAVKNSCIVL